MKHIVVLLSLLFCFQAFSQRKPKIKGNKSVVDITESLPAFNAIELKDDLTVFLQKSNQEGYSITADDNLIDVLKFKVKDSTLFISSFYKITGKKKLDITIDYYELSEITLRDGRIRMKDMISTEELTVNTYGSSKLELNANADYISITMNENSSGDFNLESDSLNIILNDRVDVGIYSVSTSNFMQMGKRAVARVEGTTNSFRIRLFDNANLKAKKLEAKGVEAILEGSPSAWVNASTDFELTSKGASKISLSGAAKIDIIEFLDTSELHKEN